MQFMLARSPNRMVLRTECAPSQGGMAEENARLDEGINLQLAVQNHQRKPSAINQRDARFVLVPRLDDCGAGVMAGGDEHALRGCAERASEIVDFYAADGVTPPLHLALNVAAGKPIIRISHECVDVDATVS